jgi:rare lipoprotein A
MMLRFPILAVLAPALCLPAEFGLASWYGYPFHGRTAADGSIYDMEKTTAAHRSLPLGTWVRVTNLANSRSIDVRITDRGPFLDGRIIDLSHAAARAIHIVEAGLAPVRVDLLEAPAALPPAEGGGFAVQIGAFQDRGRAEKLAAAMNERQLAARVTERAGQPVFWRVIVGERLTATGAASLAASLRAELGAALVVRIPEDAPRAPEALAAGNL